ncbi:hypothetical protein FACS1894190_08310 [Spirochaetia bacterium]|nr:hypothetical protein FACS1894190_08310 [Spirochaetia bacterium]
MKYTLKNDEKNIHGICPIPFTNAEVVNWGSQIGKQQLEIASCCPYFTVPYTYGIVDNEHDFMSVWNSEAAIRFREKMLKSDYSDCDMKYCNIGVLKPVFDYLNGKDIDLSSVCDYPMVVRFATSQECNLACETCRGKPITDPPEKINALNKMMDTVLLPMLQKTKLVMFSVEGEVFFSRHYKTMITRINETYPDIKYALYTNGMLLNQKNCTQFGIIDKIDSVTISIHSLQKEKYEKMMKGVKYETLIENLNWLLSLKRQNKVNTILFVCVVRKSNYKEMPDFIKFAKKYKADVRFTLYRPWEHSVLDRDEELNENCSEYSSYVKLLQKPVFRRKNCYLEPVAYSISQRSQKSPKLMMRRVIKFLLPYGFVRFIQLYKSTPIPPYKNLPVLDKVETHLVDHCNLACKGCSHYAPIAQKRFTDIRIFKKDMKILSKKVGITSLRLLGGEPLLHPDVSKFLKLARQYFPKTHIGLATNGILLPKMNKKFWKTARDNNIEIEISQYPVNAKKVNDYCELVKSKNAKLGFITVGNSFKYIINVNGDSDVYESFNRCRAEYAAHHNMYKSKLYLCGRCYNEFLNNSFGVNLPTSDGIDFYKASGQEIYEYLSKPNELCRFCLVERIPFNWAVSNNTVEDWIYSPLGSEM